ncbi:hypothetical protein O181_006598 [Austropuccinia psidii MF-1]|uniref:Uncharacterized protein n=1 Tax=Austropuccinia psidii MF-1 TaxID=1389203 RepID=A0A9Q3GGQ9_9BASI|nr:hypothetical protein [Austropuccinia psidii MF-1]
MIAKINKYAGSSLECLGQLSKIQSPTPNLNVHHHHQLDNSNTFNHQIDIYYHHLKSHSPHSSYSDHSILNNILSSHSNLNTPSTFNNQNLIQANDHGLSDNQFLSTESSSNHLKTFNPQNLHSSLIFNSPASPLEFHSQYSIRSRNSLTSTCGETSNINHVPNHHHHSQSFNLTLPIFSPCISSLSNHYPTITPNHSHSTPPISNLNSIYL